MRDWQSTHDCASQTSMINVTVVPCLFILDKVILCLIYVKDSLFYSPKAEYINEIIQKLWESDMTLLKLKAALLASWVLCTTQWSKWRCRRSYSCPDGAYNRANYKGPRSQRWTWEIHPCCQFSEVLRLMRALRKCPTWSSEGRVGDGMVYSKLGVDIVST